MIKKIICILLLITLFVTVLSGCGSDKKLIGSWETQIDVTDAISQSIEEDENLSKYIQIEEFKVSVIFTFKDDGTYSINVDEEGVSEAYAGMALSYASGLREYFTDLLAAQGSDMTVDELLENSGSTLEELAADSLDLDAYREAFLSVETDGRYKADNGKLYTTDSTDSGISKEVYDTYEFTEDGNLVFLESFGGETTGLEYPITLTPKQ